MAYKRVLIAEVEAGPKIGVAPAGSIPTIPPVPRLLYYHKGSVQWTLMCNPGRGQRPAWKATVKLHAVPSDPQSH